jgi:glycosyltransferase involved in cell wall biosynthesis
MPKVSVIVAIYNVEKHIKKCVESILAQTFVDLEIILVNDGSTDASSAACDDYAREDTRIKVVHKNNGGLFTARNSGLEVATGDYLYFMDGDDWIEPDLIELTSSIATREGVDIVMFGHVKEMRLGESSTNIIPKLPPQVYLESKSAVIDSMNVIFRAGCGFGVWELLIRASIVKQKELQFPPYQRGTDMGFLFELYGHTNSIKTLKKALYHYNAFNTTSKFNPKLIENHVTLFEKYLQVFQHGRPFNPYTAQLFVLWFAHVIPTNILSNIKLNAKSKILMIKNSLENELVRHWSNTYAVSHANGFIAKTLLLALKSRNPYIVYGVTFLKNLLKNNLTINYKRWFYR